MEEHHKQEYIISTEELEICGSITLPMYLWGINHQIVHPKLGLLFLEERPEERKDNKWKFISR